MNDSTSKILKTVDTKRTEHPWFVLSEKTLYNLDDMDPRAYMMNRNMSGCYAIYSKKEIDPEFPGTVWINGNNAGNAVLGAVFRGGQSIGFFVRPFSFLMILNIRFIMKEQSRLTEKRQYHLIW